MTLSEIIEDFRSGDPERYGNALREAEQIAAASTLPDAATSEVLAAVTTPFPEVGPQRAEEVLMVLLARHAREVCRRGCARRPAHRLRPARRRDLDRWPHHAR